MACRTYCFLLALLLALLLPIFSAGEEAGRKEEPVLGCWSPPRNLDRDYFQFLNEMGFNHTLYWRSPKIAPQRWQQDLDRAQQKNIKLIFDSWQPDAIPEQWLDAVLETACQHPAFGGIYAPDEPGYRYPLEDQSRRPSLKRFQSAYEKVRRCGKGVLFHVDAAHGAEERWIRRFLPYCTAFGLDIYPYKKGIDWRERVRSATYEASRLAEGRPVWMVLQGHGRAGWYHFATQNIGLEMNREVDPRPPAAALLEMATTALDSGADGLWWWSFELYDWSNDEHRRFILQFSEVHRQLRRRYSASWDKHFARLQLPFPLTAMYRKMKQ